MMMEVKMKIRVILPSSPQTEEIENALAVYQELARVDSIVSVVALDKSVPAEADPIDPYVIPAILRKIQEAEREGMDAIIIDCMDDPGLEAGRQLVDIPVIGPAQTSFHVAAMLGYKFSVLYPLDNPYYVEKLVESYGLMHRLASVRILDASLEVLATDKVTSINSLVKSALDAVKEDGAHVIVPGCMFTTGMAGEVQARLEKNGFPIPVVDPGLLAVRMAETLVDLGVYASRLTYPRPLGITDPYW
jgi:allantoin racemase